MKKTILVILIAVSMLFAFTACDNSIPTYKDVSYITITQNSDFVKGMDLDSSKFTVNVYNTDNSVSQLDGNGVVVAATGSAWKATADTNKVTATVAGKEASYTVKMYAPEGFEFSGVPALAVYADEGAASGNVVVPADDLKWDAADITGITASVSYNGGEKMTISYEEAAKLTDFEAFVVNAASIEKDKSYDVVIRTSAEPAAYIATGVKATGIEAPVQNPTTFVEADLVSIKSVALAANKTVWYGEEADDAAAKYVVTGVDKYGNEGTVTGAEIVFVQKNESLSTLATKDSVTVFVTANDKDGNTLTYTTTVTPKDYVDSITATAAADYKPANYTQIEKGKITVMGKLASESTATVKITDFKLSSDYVTAENRSSITVTFAGTAAYPVQDGIAETTTVNIPAPSTGSEG